MGTTWPCFNIDNQAEYSWKKNMLCIWWDQLGVVYYELLKPNEITGALYRTQLMRLSRHSRKNAPTTTPGMTKLFSCMIMLDHMLRRRSNLRNTQMGSSTPSAVFSRHCSFRLRLVLIDDAWSV